MSVAPFLLIAALAACIALLTVALTPARRSWLAAFIVALAPLPVLADAAGATTVDLSGVAGIIVSGIAAGVLWLGRVGINALVGYIQQKTKLELDEHTRDYLDRALERAASHAQAAARNVGSAPPRRGSTSTTPSWPTPSITRWTAYRTPWPISGSHPRRWPAWWRPASRRCRPPGSFSIAGTPTSG